MTLSPGDKIVSIPTKTGRVLVPAGTLTAGQKCVRIQTRTGPVLVAVNPLTVGDKVISVPTATGRVFLNPTPVPSTIHLGPNIMLTAGYYLGGKQDVWFSSDQGITWTQQTAAAEFGLRSNHSSVLLPDDTVLFLGGYNLTEDDEFWNDVWHTTDNGATWHQHTASAGWAGRSNFASVVLMDGSIVIMGGFSDGDIYLNDVWRSTDRGATWTQQTAAAEWVAREACSAVALSDNSIVLMGGYRQSPVAVLRDVWRSTDQGVTWVQQTATPWGSGKGDAASVVLIDDSILVMGGINTSWANTRDVWRSTDQGVTWVQQTATAAWSARYNHGAVALSDGSIVLMGGYPPTASNNQWHSLDQGATWHQHTNPTPWWGPRYWHSVS